MQMRDRCLVLIIDARKPKISLSMVVKLGARCWWRDTEINYLRRAIFSAAIARAPPGRNSLNQIITKLKIEPINLIMDLIIPEFCLDFCPTISI